MAFELYTPAELLALSLDPGWAEAEPDTRRLLAVDLSAPVEGDAATLRAWLALQPVPVIGVGTEGQSPLEGAVDLVVAPGAEAERAVANVLAQPQAASVLVQVLRATEAMDVQQALTVESLAYATLQAGSEFGAWLAARRADRPEQIVPVKDDIVIVERIGNTLEITLNSPESRNSMSVAMRDALCEAFKLAAIDPEIDQVHVSGSGPCFSVGGELEEFGSLPDPATAHATRMLRMPGRFIVPQAHKFTCRVHRACIGAGIEMPAFAGRVIAASNTFFQLPELSLGLIPGAGGCVSIPRRIGRRRTAWMAVLNKKVNAERALEWGLVDAIED